MAEQENKYPEDVSIPLPDSYQGDMMDSDSDLVLDIPFPEVVALEEEMDHIHHPERYEEITGLSFGEFERMLAKAFDISSLSAAERIAAFLRYQQWHEEIEEAVYHGKNGRARLG